MSVDRVAVSRCMSPRPWLSERASLNNVRAGVSQRCTRFRPISLIAEKILQI